MATVASQKTTEERMADLKAEYPAMFDHPGQQPNEICLSVQLIDVAALNGSNYKRNGLLSARLGETCMGKLKGRQDEVACIPIFVDAAEFFTLDDKHAEESK